MAFSQGKLLSCILRSAQYTSSITSVLRPTFVRGSLQGRCSARPCCSNTVSESALSASSAAAFLHPLPVGSSHYVHSPFASGLELREDDHLTQTLAPTSASIAEYKCPATELLGRLSQIAILDKTPGHNVSYECPVGSPIVDSVAPDLGKSEVSEPGSKPEAKEAKIIMRIRHKKMKKHKLRKLRKRMYFLWKKQKRTRKAKRLVIYNKELESIKATGEQFDAEDFVRSQLAKARRGGYYINVFETKQ